MANEITIKNTTVVKEIYKIKGPGGPANDNLRE
jgi:hypothetical protein